MASDLNVELVNLHRHRLDELGRDPSGLYAHYEAQVGRGVLISDRHRGTLQIIDADLPAYGTYVVLRAGLGEFALLLAASGRHVIACEPNGYRYAAIEAGRSRLEEAGLLVPGALALVKAFVPEAPMKGQAIAIGLSALQAADDAAAAPLLSGLTTFTALLIELRLFLRRRETPAEQAAAAEALSRVGFAERQDFPGVALAWFRRPAASEGATRPRASSKQRR